MHLYRMPVSYFNLRVLYQVNLATRCEIFFRKILLNKFHLISFTNIAAL